MLGGSLESGTARDHAPGIRDGEIVPVRDWGAFCISTTKPLLTWKRGVDVLKGTLVKTVEFGSLVEHHARRRGRMQGRPGSAALPSEPGLTAVGNEAARKAKAKRKLKPSTRQHAPRGF